MNKLSEKLIVKQAIAPQDIGTADVTSAYIEMESNRLLAVLTTASLTAGKVATIELLQATAAAGTGSKPLKAAVTGTAPTGNGAVTVQVEVSGDEFDTNNGFKYVAVKVTCDEATKLGSAVAIFGGLRYSN